MTTVNMINSFQTVFGNVGNPFQTINPTGSFYGDLASAKGLVLFLSNILKLIVTAASVYSLFQIITAAFQFINAGGNPKNIETAWLKISQVLVGLILIVSSIALAGILGYLLFGNALAILNPKVYGP